MSQLFSQQSQAHTLRDYQLEAVEAVEKEFNECRGTLVILPTGAGKTQVACDLIRRNHGRCLFIAHRDELIQQAAKRIEQFTGTWPDIEQSSMKADHYGYNHVVASIQTLSRKKRLERFDPSEFDLIIVDECFVAGTMVGAVCIENLRVGDYVKTHTGKTRKIVRLFKSRPKSLVEVTANNKRVICTTNHPFLSDTGWVESSLLSPGDMVLCVNENYVDMRSLRWRYKTFFRFAACLLRKMQNFTKRGEEKKNSVSMSLVRWISYTNRTEEDKSHWWQVPSILFHRMQKSFYEETKLRNDGKDKPEICIRANEKKQPNVKGRNKNKSKKHVKSYWTRAKSSWWKWSWADVATAIAIISSWLGDRSSCTNKNFERKWLSNLLQDRYSKSRPKNCSRGRWFFSWCNRKTRTRSKERNIFNWIRVDGVKILEQTSDGTFGGMCPDGYVYNIEVEKDHSYTANGFVVHNCHHACAKTYRRVINYFNGKILGITATPDRLDKASLGQVIDSVAYRYGINDAIADGWLCNVITRIIRVESMDFSKVHTLAGDFNQGELDAIMNLEQNLHSVAKPTVECAGDRKTIVFTTSVAHAERLAEIIDRYTGKKAAFVVHGGTPKEARRKLLNEFHRGEWQFFVNVQVAAEGYDEPGVSCISMARPTKSRALYSQMVGRGLRGGRRFPIDGKENLLVLDFTGNSGKHDIASVVDALGGNASPEEIKRAKKIIEKSNKPESIDEAIEKAKEEFERAKEISEKAKQRRRNIVGEVSYKIENLNPFNMFKLKRDYLTEKYGMAPATERQVAAIEKWLGPKHAKKAPQNLSRHEASKLLKEFAERRDKGLATYAQVACLARKGVDARDWNFHHASAAIGWFAKNGWNKRLPNSLMSYEREPGEDG